MASGRPAPRTDYLLEAKWQQRPVRAPDLDSLAGKLSRKLDNTLGLYLSINGYSEDAVRVHSSGRRLMLLMDGSDLMAVLEGRIKSVHKPGFNQEIERSVDGRRRSRFGLLAQALKNDVSTNRLMAVPDQFEHSSSDGGKAQSPIAA